MRKLLMALFALAFLMGCATTTTVIEGDQKLAIARITARAAGTAVAMEDVDWAGEAVAYCDKMMEVDDKDLINSLALTGLKLLGERYTKYGIFLEDVEDMMIILGFNLVDPEPLNYPVEDMKGLVQAFKEGLERGIPLA